MARFRKPIADKNDSFLQIAAYVLVDVLACFVIYLWLFGFNVYFVVM